LSNDGRYALVSDSYGKHVLVDTASRLTQSTSDTRVLVLTPDGRLLKVDYDGVLTTQDIGSGSLASNQETRVMELGLSAVNTLILSPDGRRAFAGTRSGAGVL